MDESAHILDQPLSSTPSISRQDAEAIHGARTKYRADIDGLRALAVIPVVLFHLGLPIFRGGFVGVDVFFVISGFLITSIIDREIREGSFSVLGFYERRVKRIFPALFVMMAVVTVASAIILLPPEFKNFGQSVAATSFFSSNLMFWYQGMDYFDGPADLKPLLHTWSLAVEEQYYIVFPLFLLFVRSARTRTIALVLTALVSLALSQYYLSTLPASSFYLPQSRAWELLAGALVALRPGWAEVSGKWANWLQPAGLLAILAAMLFYTNNTPFPGLAGLLPVLGASAVVFCGDRISIVNPLTNPVVIFFGKISYSLYLWHWPLIVLYKYVLMREIGRLDALVIFAGSVALASASYYFVERPTRRRASTAYWGGRPALFGAGLAAMLLFTGIGGSVHLTNGMPQRLADYHPPITVKESMPEVPPHCWISLVSTGQEWGGTACAVTKGSHLAMLWGDSFALQYVTGFHDAESLLDSRILLLAKSGCPPLLDYTQPMEPNCRAFNNLAWQRIGEMKPETVIISARWIYNALDTSDRVDMLAALKRTIAALEKRHIHVVLIGESPSYEFQNTYDYLYRAKRLHDGPIVPKLQFGPDFVRAIQDVAGPAEFVNPMKTLCQGDACSLFIGKDFMTLDGGHLTRPASDEVVRSLLRQDCAGPHYLAVDCRQLAAANPPATNPPAGNPPVAGIDSAHP
ncbi:MAG TPA: acyltransferase family protein [Stellaceae bacterium]|nr:acyltransferase family protein [Stellaceae bacterium]